MTCKTNYRHYPLCYFRICQEGLTGTIEPLNTVVTAPNYYLDNPEKGKMISHFNFMGA